MGKNSEKGQRKVQRKAIKGKLAQGQKAGYGFHQDNGSRESMIGKLWASFKSDGK